MLVSAKNFLKCGWVVECTTANPQFSSSDLGLESAGRAWVDPAMVSACLTLGKENVVEKSTDRSIHLYVVVTQH